MIDVNKPVAKYTRSNTDVNHLTSFVDRMTMMEYLLGAHIVEAGKFNTGHD